MADEICLLKSVKDFIEIASECYRLGWNERNGGNISYLLEESELEPILKLKNKDERIISLEFNAKEISKKYFLVTGSGKYFKNIKKEPEVSLGIIQINDNGTGYKIIWGFKDNGIATSELSTHLMSHIVRLKIDPNHRAILHCHTPYINALSFTSRLNDREITKLLWRMISECVIVFPEGIGVIPWEVPGTELIGKMTSQKMKDARLVLWPHHGVFAAGVNMDEAFGLIETAEKAAQIYTIAQEQGEIRQYITDEQLSEIIKAYNLKIRNELFK